MSVCLTTPDPPTPDPVTSSVPSEHREHSEKKHRDKEKEKPTPNEGSADRHRDKHKDKRREDKVNSLDMKGEHLHPYERMLSVVILDGIRPCPIGHGDVLVHGRHC